MINSSNNSYKYLSAILGVLLLVSLFFNFKKSEQIGLVEKDLANEIVDKNDAIKKLENLKAIYDEALVDQSELNEDLEIERNKVNNLLSEIKRNKVDASSLAKYQREIKDLENKMRTLILENDALKKANADLNLQMDSVQVELGATSEKNQALNDQNEELNKKILRASRLVITNLKAEPFKFKSSGQAIETDKASRVNAIKVEFTIPKNELANSGEKVYFIQIIDPKNNIVGEKKEINFEDKLLVYSFPSKVNYKNETIKVSEIIKGQDFVKGRYLVNIFDNTIQVSSESFELR